VGGDWAGGERVLYLTVTYGSLPWIALALAFTFAFYGLLRKTAPLSSLHGLSLETAVLFIPALAYLLFLEFSGRGSFGHVDGGTTFLLAFAGVATAVPLLLFGAAARRIALSAVGIMQYIAPTIQFLIGVFLYKEPFSGQQMVGFGLVWVALAVYVGEGVWFGRRSQR
jgi:chloramphenicol-sensitive protein RarD